MINRLKNINNDYGEKRFYDKQVKKILTMIMVRRDDKQIKKNINNDCGEKRFYDKIS